MSRHLQNILWSRLLVAEAPCVSNGWIVPVVSNVTSVKGSRDMQDLSWMSTLIPLTTACLRRPVRILPLSSGAFPTTGSRRTTRALRNQATALTESLVDLTGHMKKVTLLRYHPTASNVLLSTSADYTTKVWDIEKGEAVTTFTEMQDLIQDIVWDTRGDVYATSCKDKAVRFVDGRQGTLASSIPIAHEGSKSVKLAYMGDSGKFLSCGWSKQSAREMKIWDIKHLGKPLHTEKVDTASGAMIPLYDSRHQRHLSLREGRRYRATVRV